MSPAPSPLTRKRLVYCLFGVAVVALGLLAPLLVRGGRAQDLSNQLPPDGNSPLEGPEMGGMLLRLVGGTVVVLGLCVGCLWICRRWIGVRSGKADAGASLEVLESLSLTGLCRVDLVRAGGHYLLAGMDGAGLKVVLPVDGSPDAEEELTGNIAQQVATNAA